MTAPTVEYATPVAVKLFPAIVTEPDDTVVDGLLVILTAKTDTQPARLIAYGEGGEGGIVKAFTYKVVTVAGIRPDADVSFGWIITDADGGRWRLRNGTGCGCTSPLNSLSKSTQPLPLRL